MNMQLAQITGLEDQIDLPRTGDPETSVQTILTIVFGLGGAVAMLVIVIAGIMFILSRGDPQKSATARNAIIYAGVGLAIMVLAFSIVGFVATEVS